MDMRIETSGREPIYRQLARQIREAIATGKLAEEERLPSVRELSRRLVVNPNTIARVYTELEREGVLHTRQGMGVFVAQPNNELSQPARRKKLYDRIDALLTEAVYLGFTPEQIHDAVTERARQFKWGKA